MRYISHRIPNSVSAKSDAVKNYAWMGTISSEMVIWLTNGVRRSCGVSPASRISASWLASQVVKKVDFLSVHTHALEYAIYFYMRVNGGKHLIIVIILVNNLAKVLKNCEISKFLVVFCDFSCIYDKKAVSLQPFLLRLENINCKIQTNLLTKNN